MYFAGSYSRFKEGEQVYYKAPDSTLYEPCTIVSIGILGSKLSEHIFLYEVVSSFNGQHHKVTEEVLSKDAGGNHNKTLHLILKGEWFDMIKSGKKREEYRTIKRHWFTKFCFGSLEGDELSLLCQYLRGGFSEYPVDLNYINLGRHGRRIDSNGIPINDLSSAFDFGLYLCKYQTVVFHRGYTEETLEFNLDSITIGKGKAELGAPDENVFVIKFSDKHD